MHRQEAAKMLIINDIQTILDIFSSCSEDTRIHFMLGGLLYFSTIISGAVDWCNKANINIDCVVDKNLIDKLRAKVKLYSGDNAISFDEQKIIMSDIITIEKQYWLDEQAKSGKLCPEWIIPDIGSYKVNGHYIGNTLEYAYEYSPLNLDKQPIIKALRGESQESSLAFNFAIKIGQTIQNLYYNMTGNAYILNDKKSNSITVTPSDFRMSNHRFFKKENSIYAFNLCCRLNYLLELFLPIAKTNPFLAFRMIYITFYHIKDDFINLGLDFIHYNMPYRNKTFRNAMAHYSLYGKIEDSEIIDSVIGCGLIEKFFKESFDIINQEMVEEFIKTRNSLEKYVKV